MHIPENILLIPATKTDHTENSYFGNPYQLRYEQYGLEYLDRKSESNDEIERVAILGYN